MPKEKTDTSHLKELLGHANIHSSVAVYVQIENNVRFAIASGALKAGDQIPSVRELSDWLDINPNTVAKSYRDLEVMGLLYTRRGMGCYVNKGVQAQCRDKCRAQIAARLFEVCAEAKAAGMTAATIKGAAQASYKSGGNPYADPPKAIMALAKTKK